MNTTMERPAAPTREINSLRDVRRALKRKYGSLTIAAQRLEIAYVRLSAAINGRESIIAVIGKLQSELGLSDAKVLELWPLLRKWPREVA